MIRTSTFRPAWWLTNRHLQTIFPNTLRRQPRLALRRERLELPDGDFVDVDWTTDSSGPIVIVLHGLEGSIDSRYASGIMRTLDRRGWRGALLHHRGCSGEINRLASGYHSGQTADLDYFIKLLRQREPGTPLAAVGYSLGGNVLLKWLGETRNADALQAAVAISVPMRLDLCSDGINRGFSKVYQSHLMRRMRRTALRKIDAGILDMPKQAVRKLKTFRQFDDALTGPLHGFGNAETYYAQCSSRQFLKHIATPTLIIQSRDDPFMTPEVIPSARELSGQVILELAEHGGHVGFVGGAWPWRARYWLEDRIPAFLEDFLEKDATGDVTEVLEYRQFRQPAP